MRLAARPVGAHSRSRTLFAARMRKIPLTMVVLPTPARLTFRILKVQFVGNFGGALGGSGIVGRLVVDQPFGLVLPSLHESLHEFLGLAIVGDGPAQESGLLGRYHAMDVPARLQVDPSRVLAGILHRLAR